MPILKLTNTKYSLWGIMLENVTIKMPDKMKKALVRLAEQEFSSVSGVLKKAAEIYLKENGIDWRKEESE